MDDQIRRADEGQTVVAPGMEPVAAAFFATVPEGEVAGASLSIWVDGHEVVSLAAGTADADSKRAFDRASLVPIASVTKGLASLLISVLIERGTLPGFDEPITAVWPEFAAHGKGDISIGDVLAHRAGLSAPPRPVTDDELYDPLAMARMLAAQEPLWTPGEGHQYHTVTHGGLTARIVAAAGGDSFSSDFRSVIADPLAADVWVGLPPEEDHRVVRMFVPAVAEVSAFETQVHPWITRANDLGRGLDLIELLQSEQGRRSAIPGANGIGSASGLAKIWSAAVVETAGIRLLSEESARRLRKPRSTGPAVVAGDPPYQHWGAGVMIPSHWEWYLGPDSFGHDGAHGQVAFADAYHRVGFAYLTNRSGDWERGRTIIEALRKAL
ncbi:beta-lactamase family protein [Microbacteriaceae bacterium VKM Ac-2855]|nr:beta-lactamase family protein [Microbacteriaceae bacterium VKM Ac-2855]